MLEQVQRRATKYITSDYKSSYRDRLITLQILPMTMYLEYLDIKFLLRALKNNSHPANNFNIYDHISFHSSTTRAGTHFKLIHTSPKSTRSSHTYFHRIPRLWNKLPTFDLSLSVDCNCMKLRNFLWHHFMNEFDSNNPCSFYFMCPCPKCIPLSTCNNYSSF